MSATTVWRNALPEYIVPTLPPTPEWLEVIRVPADGTQIHLTSALMVWGDLASKQLETTYRALQLSMTRSCYLSTIDFIPWIATWGKEGWEKRAVIGGDDLHIIYTQAEGSLIPNKHVDGRVFGDIIIAKIAAKRGKNGWEYEDVDPEWLDTVFMEPYLGKVKSMSSEQAHGRPK